MTFQSLDQNSSEFSLTFSLMDVPFSLVTTRKELRSKVMEALRKDSCARYFVAVNPEKICRAQRDGELRRALAESSGNYADGIGLVLALRFIYRVGAERIAGIDFFEEVLGILEQERGSVFFFGASEEVNQGCAERVKKEFPGISVVGRQNGLDADPEDLVSEINRLRPDFIAVALGSPLQERWMLENASRINAKVLMGVGGTFDVFAGKVQRAPHFLRKVGLEWSFRFVQNPSRIRRYLRLGRFVGSVLLQWIRSKPRGS